MSTIAILGIVLLFLLGIRALVRDIEKHRKRILREAGDAALAQIARLARKLYDELRELDVRRGNNDPIEVIVEFFQITSAFQDEHEQRLVSLRDRIEQAELPYVPLVEHFLCSMERMGRVACGFNRAKEGEMVTAQNVFLGDIWGLWTQSVSYWVSNRARLMADEDHRFHVSIYSLLQEQAGNFMTSNREELLAEVRKLEVAAADIQRSGWPDDKNQMVNKSLEVRKCLVKEPMYMN